MIIIIKCTSYSFIFEIKKCLAFNEFAYWMLWNKNLLDIFVEFMFGDSILVFNKAVVQHFGLCDWCAILSVQFRCCFNRLRINLICTPRPFRLSALIAVIRVDVPSEIVVHMCCYILVFMFQCKHIIFKYLVTIGVHQPSVFCCNLECIYQMCNMIIKFIDIVCLVRM